jgi:SRSO17 transposase
LVRIAKARWPIEQDYRELKEERGLDHSEGRQCLGWHHRVYLVTMAYAFLRFAQARLKKTSGATWSLARMRRQRLAVVIRLNGRCAWCLTRFNDTS